MFEALLHAYAYVPAFNEEGEDVGYIDMRRKAQLNKWLNSVRAQAWEEGFFQGNTTLEDTVYRDDDWKTHNPFGLPSEDPSDDYQK